MYKVTNLSRQIWMSINVLLSLLYTPDSLFVFLLYWMAKFEISSLEGLHNTLRLTWFFFDQLQIYQEATYCWICQSTELVCVIILWDIVALFETILSIMRACLLFSSRFSPVPLKRIYAPFYQWSFKLLWGWYEVI